MYFSEDGRVGAQTLWREAGKAGLVPPEVKIQGDLTATPCACGKILIETGLGCWWSCRASRQGTTALSWSTENQPCKETLFPLEDSQVVAQVAQRGCAVFFLSFLILYWKKPWAAPSVLGANPAVRGSLNWRSGKVPLRLNWDPTKAWKRLHT